MTMSKKMASQNIVHHQSIEEWLAMFPRFDGRKGMKPGLERMEAFLERLGNPHRNLKFIHVAGTNGKGSTCAYLASMYRAGGYTVGLYTSPYLIHFNDRMAVNGVDITESDLQKYAGQIKPYIEAIRESPVGGPTEFELVTLLAILFFADRAVDVVVWETGLGGRLDATNVVTPLASVITNIGFDHVHILGDTIAKIAGEKAGIIKPSVPVVTAVDGEALEVIRHRAKELGSSLYVLDRDFSYDLLHSDLHGQRLNFSGSVEVWDNIEVGMLGTHQCINASVALQTIQLLEHMQILPLTEEQVRFGLNQARWPGRLEVMSQNPLIVIDGAHNPHGATALDKALQELFGHFGGIVVIGMLQDKVQPEILGPILHHADHVIVTQPDTPRAADCRDLAQAVQEWRDRHLPVPSLLQIDIRSSVPEALELACKVAGNSERMLVTGSLYTISEARKWLTENTSVR